MLAITRHSLLVTRNERVKISFVVVIAIGCVETSFSPKRRLKAVVT